MFDNELVEISENLFQGLSNLEELDLSFNNLVKIKANTFIDLLNLKRFFIFFYKYSLTFHKLFK